MLPKFFIALLFISLNAWAATPAELLAWFTILR